jgi:tripartite-type tricarboxylate transporter receptor subunit TctC
MKKLILFLTVLATSSLAYAQQTVQVIWPFSIGSLQATMVRTIIDKANEQQSVYKFVFVNKPGAGGTVAAHFTTQSKELTVLASSSSFYIRPLLYKDSHNVDDFRVVALFCSSQPLAIFSKTTNNMSDLLKRDVTIGVLPGSITTLVTRSIASNHSTATIREIPYKGTVESTADMLGGHIDGSVDFIGTAALAKYGPDVRVLGVTGHRSSGGYPTFKSGGINGLEDITNDYFFFVNSSVDPKTRDELHRILTSAYTDKTKDACESDFGQLALHPFDRADAIHNSNIQRWKRLTVGIQSQ